MKKFIPLFLLLLIFSCSEKKVNNKHIEVKKETWKVIFPTEKIDIELMKEYLIEPQPFTKSSKLQLEENDDNWRFRTRYREAFKKEADFAGKYKVVQWGCGTACQVNSLVNLETGQIIDGFTSSMGVEYKMNSTIFIVDPFSEEDFQDGRSMIYGTAKIYNFDGTNFQLLKKQKYEVK